jgi:hypothetical protein
MSACDDANTEAICPCGKFSHPRVIFNLPGRDGIAYRIGNYTTFRHALLQARTGETELSSSNRTQVAKQVWRPSAEGDLALQMVEWWAYLADVLTFYNERVARQAYLRTTELPESVNRLIRLLGYRPRPGIGAVGVLAALAEGPKPFTLPKGFQVQSKPGPGKQPQVFELEADTKVGALATGPSTSAQGTIDAEPAPDPTRFRLLPDPSNSVSVFLQGTSSAVKPGEEVLLLLAAKSPKTSGPSFVIATVSSVSHEKDARHKPITRIQFAVTDELLKIIDVTAYSLHRSDQSAHVYQYTNDPGIVIQTSGSVHLETITRVIKVGDPILFEDPSSTSPTPQLVYVTAYHEVIFYANNPSDPSHAPPPVPPSTTPPLAIPIPHTQLDFTPVLLSAWKLATVLLRYAWKDVGNLTAPPIASVGDAGSNAGSAPTPITLQPSDGRSFPGVKADTPVLIEDAISNGASGVLGPSSTLQLADPVPLLIPPLRVLFNLLPVTRGKTVTSEVLGNGNAALAGQDFVLQNAPVTYLQSPASTSGDNYSSTIRVWINKLEWLEVRNFYDQPADSEVFVTREDEQGKTHVLFGDGEHGARLPTGTNNVVASYRYGSGAEAPPAGSLTIVLQPQPGLKAIRNPVPVGGGSDPDSPKRVRQLAPRSVLTFNRAVSADDYEAIAARAPGVVRARAAYAFDAVEQRPRVKIWVGDDQGAVKATRIAIADTADPNLLPSIELAKQIIVNLNVTLILDPRHDPKTVLDAVHAALLDPDSGLLGVNVVRIGQALFDSQVFAACLSVAGVRAVHDYSFSPEGMGTASGASTSVLKMKQAVQINFARTVKMKPLILKPGVFGRQFVLPACQCEHRHDPGEGGYFSLPDDGRHLTVSSKGAQ